MIYVTVKVERTIPCHSVVQLSKYFAQNWSVSLAKNAVPKLAIIFKEVLAAVAARCPFGQVIGMVKISWREVAVRRFEAREMRANLSSAMSKTCVILWKLGYILLVLIASLIAYLT